MPSKNYSYIIIGSGLAGANAIEGIRERDQTGSILLIGSESHLPYDRPPLTKKLWWGKKKVDDIFLHPLSWYEQNNVTVMTGTTIISIDKSQKTITDSMGNSFQFSKLLLATGCIPRQLPIQGGTTEGICYYRTLSDYQKIRSMAAPGKSAVIIGGGFIGSELAASLNVNHVDVTMIFPSPYICDRVFPDYLAKHIGQVFLKKGIKLLNPDAPVHIGKEGDQFTIDTKNGISIKSHILIAGIGVKPVVELAEMAELQIENGIVVNETLQTSNPDIYAAGDNARFFYPALQKSMRFEHWDCAVTQGKQAGKNMAGANEPYTHLPYFFSDLFEFGYEAVGEINSTFETRANWQKENETGVIYYLSEGKIRGAMMCNVWGKTDAASDIIRKGLPPENLKDLIH